MFILDCFAEQLLFKSVLSRMSAELDYPREVITTKQKNENIDGRLPENSHNSFVDLQSKKTVKRQTKN